MKILLADDSRTMRRLIANALAGIGQTDVLEADCGEDVLSVLAANPGVELVLLDRNMPLMNGLDCLKAIRANPATSGLPVIMVTADAAEESVIEALRSGASGYLVKPFSPEKLKEVIGKFVRCGE